MRPPTQLIYSVARHKGNKQLTCLAQQMFRMYTEQGFPPDMFLDQLRNSTKANIESELIFIVSEYMTLFLEHRRRAGIADKRVEEARGRNRREIARFISTGELGAY